MKISRVRNLHPGDEVFWNDPDGGVCSRSLVISSIVIVGEVIIIFDDEGGTLECFAVELS